ncbi:unnamed protein product [Paramecium pentaurelia]|uniref:SIAH-type domain-containing protein n=1 Tax=Paramecium pentaurelia TaxID=43138 RepID=A0A8S1XYZ9_9CILI|nr:unnamed protein product [Paramecium pentaurelia]
MNFPLPENRIANYAKVSTFLPHLVCQCCKSLSLQQLICLKCHENFCFKCIPYADDQIPEPIEITVQTILINKNTKYIQDINYRGFCPNCEVVTVLTSQLPKMFHKLYTSVKFSCQNRINGCPEELCYPDLRIHEQKCGYNTITCPKQECGQQTYKKDFITHVSICNPTTECICGSTNQHDQQKCLKLQCETLKSQLNTQTKELQLLKDVQTTLSYSSPQKQLNRVVVNQSPYIATSPFSLQGLLQQSAQILNDG